jgi:cell wall-associated NlpC family hydrolase
MNRSSTTVTIFDNKSEKIDASKTNYNTNTINGVVLKPGDLLGWPAVGGKSGHVLIYVGNGNLAEVHGPTYPGRGTKNQATRISPLKTYSYLNLFTNIKRL